MIKGVINDFFPRGLSQKAKWIPFIFLSLQTMFHGPAVKAAVFDSLQGSFVNPPDSAKPFTWWHWVNGNITKEGIEADLKAIKEIGEGGATIVDVGHIGIPSGPAPFMSREWQNDFTFAVQEANKLGLKLGLENCDGWSSSGGPWVKPQYAMQMVVSSSLNVQGSQKLDIVLQQPETRLGYYRDIETLAFPTPAGHQRIQNIKFKADYSWRYGLQPDFCDVQTNAIIPSNAFLNLSKLMASDGRLVWSVPSGNWTILRIGYTPVGEKNHPASNSGWGLECDKLSKTALDQYWAGFMQKIVEETAPYTGKTLTSSLIDSYEVGAQNWSPDFRKDFQRLRGYDPLPWLPVLNGWIIQSDAKSERFLWDMRLSIADLFAQNYYGYFQVLCHKHGLRSHIEPYDGPYECLQVGQAADVPMGEFWYDSNEKHYSCKLAASVGHIYGRQVIGAESFTAQPAQAGWQADPYSMKALGDLKYTEGVNRFVFHEFAMQPWLKQYPGMTMGPYGTELSRTITWWKQGRAWIRYLTRCQYLLQQGDYVADVCYYAGLVAPNEAPYHSELKTQGYDYDAIDANVLLHMMAVHDGQLTLPDGMHYRLLVLPNSPFMTLPELKKLRDLINKGATVIGPKPAFSPSLKGYPDSDVQIQKMAGSIWGNCDGKNVRKHSFGRGCIFWGKSVPEVLADMGIKPDFHSEELHGEPGLAWIHRCTNSIDIYFVSNQRPTYDFSECTFRVSGKQPEFWHPDTGEIEPAPIWREHDGWTTLPINFQPAGSVFVIFYPKQHLHDHVVSAWADYSPHSNQTKLQILRAIYKSGDGRVETNETDTLSKFLHNSELVVKINATTMGFKPSQNQKMTLNVDFEVNGLAGNSIVPEGGILRLPQAGANYQEPPWSVRIGADGLPLVTFWRNGVVKLHTFNGLDFRAQSTNVPAPQEVSGSWNLSFPAHWGAPQNISLNRLISWTDDTNNGVRYFSGTATYKKEIDISSDQLTSSHELWLDLGEIKNLAEVSLNGHVFDVLWKPPFHVNITSAARPGTNELLVKVTNLWINRLIGDEQLPPDCEWDGNKLKEWPKWLLEGKPSPTGRFTFTTWRHFTNNFSLMESGLLGPVTLRTAEIVKP